MRLDDLATPGTVILRPATLARFAEPLSWPRILGQAPGPRMTNWWREAVMQAEDDGLLWWDTKTRTWTLTEAGRELALGAA